MLDDADTSAVFQALAHESRRRMLDLVKASPGIGIGELAREFDVSRIAVMKHLRVLEEAGLLVSEKHGRVRRLYRNLMPIQLIYDRWTDEYSAFWAGHMADLKYRVEGKATFESKESKKRKEKGKKT